MTTVGGNLERKEIGLPIGVSGTHNNTEIDAATGYLRLAQVDTDDQGNPVYAEKGTWISDVINLEDKFHDFEKVFSNSIDNGASSIAILTRVSDNNVDWSEWTAVAIDGAILSDTKQYIQVRIDLLAGFVTDVFIIANSDFENNEFVEEKLIIEGDYIIPKLTSNTSSDAGFAFSETEYSSSYSAWRAFDKVDRNEGYVTKNDIITGHLGFFFNNEVAVSKYKIRSMSSVTYLPSMPKSWILQASNDTSNGNDGTWIDLDIQENQVWSSVNTDKEYALKNIYKYKAYRIKWSENNGYKYTGFGEFDFYQRATTVLILKRNYQYDMTLDSTSTDTVSLHRKKITRDEWVRIDRLEVVDK
ncbi:hypothetical protein P9B03_11960 [Metasolibacillus meyeri]|uniref:F5/8 type C domain-containing protein n=1 Tax=Metasolibacillus meyeri TaxID=1071052 RepID=A0AAW9NW54_9BACL|nr:hypothetical protein [Metasolibacillus meyeri]MEC1179201.1 hypothetical protein [Metasolibacillus meyeri]